MLGWQPKVSLRDGLSKTIEYFDGLLRSRGGAVRAPSPD
jgi:UDP-glucuronate decarboxylase